MRQDDAARSRHMLDAAEEAIGFTQGHERIDLDQDRKLTINLDILWKTVEEDLPPLIEMFEQAIGEE